MPCKDFPHSTTFPRCQGGCWIWPGSGQFCCPAAADHTALVSRMVFPGDLGSPPAFPALLPLHCMASCILPGHSSSSALLWRLSVDIPGLSSTLPCPSCPHPQPRRCYESRNQSLALPACPQCLTPAAKNSLKSPKIAHCCPHSPFSAVRKM